MLIFKRPITRVLTSSLFMAIFATNIPVFAEGGEANGKGGRHEHGTQDWPGIYFGSLPCADCVAIKTSLALNKNNSYVLITQYLGKSEREFVEKGKYTADDKANTLVLTPRNSTNSQQYLVEDNALIQLDSHGNRVTGKQADRYILRRTDVTQAAPAHAH